MIDVVDSLDDLLVQLLAMLFGGCVWWWICGGGVWVLFC